MYAYLASDEGVGIEGGQEGHELSPDDLLLDFEDRLLDHIFEMEQAKAAGILSLEDEKRLEK